MSSEHPLSLAMAAKGYNVSRLANESGVSRTTIRSILNGTSDFKTNWTVAEYIAAVLKVPMRQLFDINSDLSHLGRPAATGKQLIVVDRTKPAQNEVLCHACRMIGPRPPQDDAYCTNCGTSLTNEALRGNNQ